MTMTTAILAIIGAGTATSWVFQLVDAIECPRH